MCLGFPADSAGKESACSAGDTGDTSSVPGKIPWRRKWQPSPVFLPEKPHGQRNLVGSSPQGRRVEHDRAPPHHNMHLTDVMTARYLAQYLTRSQG